MKPSRILPVTILATGALRIPSEFQGRHTQLSRPVGLACTGPVAGPKLETILSRVYTRETPDAAKGGIKTIPGKACV